MGDSVAVTIDAKKFLAVFTVLLGVLPLIVLFLVRDVVAPALNLTRGLADGLAIVSSVVCVQLILVWSCIKGFQPERDEIHEKVN